MRHFTSRRFWKCFNNLPEHVQELSNRKFNLLKKNPKHPSLHFKKIGSLWSVRVDDHYRALAVEDEEDMIWVWIGHHDEYERLLAASR